MTPLHELSTLGLHLQVNGIDIGRAGMRRRPDEPDEFDLVVEDPSIGAFALDENFALAVRHADDEPWLTVELAEAKEKLVSALSRLEGDSLPKTSKRVRYESLRKASAGNAEPESEVVGLVGNFEHIRRTVEVLYHAHVPAIVTALQPDSDWFRAGAVIWTPSLRSSRKLLKEAGFRPHPRFTAVLFEPTTGRAIELQEHRIAG